MGRFSLMYDINKMAQFLQSSNYIQNVNTGSVQPPEYTTGSPMAYSQTPLYNNPNTLHADMTKIQSNYLNPKQVL